MIEPPKRIFACASDQTRSASNISWRRGLPSSTANVRSSSGPPDEVSCVYAAVASTAKSSVMWYAYARRCRTCTSGHLRDVSPCVDEPSNRSDVVAAAQRQLVAVGLLEQAIAAGALLALREQVGLDVLVDAGVAARLARPRPWRPPRPRRRPASPAVARARPTAPTARPPASASDRADPQPQPQAEASEDGDVVRAAPAPQHLLRNQEVAHVQAEGDEAREVELEAEARLPGQPQHRLVERPAGARDREDVAVDDGRLGELELGVDGRPEQRRDPLAGGAGREVLLLIERAERLLQAELDRRARDQHLEAEVFRRVECDRASVAVRGRERVGRVVAAQRRELEAVLLQEVAPLDALALAVGGFALQAGERVQVALGLLFVLGALLGGGLRGVRLVGRGSRRPVWTRRFVSSLRRRAWSPALSAPRSSNGLSGGLPLAGAASTEDPLVSPTARASTTVVARTKVGKS